MTQCSAVESRRDPKVGALYAVLHKDTFDAHRVGTADANFVVFVNTNPNRPPIVCARADLHIDRRIIGQIVWSSHKVEDS